MTRLWKYSGAIAMVVLLATYAGAMTTLQQEDQIFEGKLISIDVAANVLTVQGAENKETQFTFTPDTAVVGADSSVQGLAGKPGTNVKVHYKTDGSSHVATRIEVLGS